MPNEHTYISETYLSLMNKRMGTVITRLFYGAVECEFRCNGQTPLLCTRNPQGIEVRAKFHYTGPTGPDQTKSADFVGDPGLVRSVPVRPEFSLNGA